MSPRKDTATRGVIFQPVDEPDVFRAMVREVESLGYANLWCTDSSLHARNVYSYLTLAALESTTLFLGSAVTNPLTRHPAITASAMATIDEVSRGRAILGIGAGDRPLLSLGLKPSKLADLESSIADIRALWSGVSVTHEAQSYRLDGAHMRLPSREDLPVYISASGPKSLELAGRVANGVLILAGLFDEALEWAISCVRKGAVDAGRDPRECHVGVCAYGAINDDDPASTMEPARSIASWFPQTAPMVCELAGLDATLVERVRSNYQGGEFQEAGEAAALLPDDFVRRVALSGTRKDAAARIAVALDAGADSVELFPLGSDRMGTVRAFVDSWNEATGP
ncbi:MAG: LLM class flavin-dependent oxidoreductase [Acidimicrobiales bacterium]